VQIVRDALEKDPSILREAIVALQADNARITAEATRTAIASRHDAIFAPSDPRVGNTQARIAIAEFFDPSCPYCRQLAPQMIRFLAKQRDVELVYKDMPILGPASNLGSRALLAAQRQGAYESLRDSIMRDPRDITLATIQQSAQRLGLNWPRLRHDMDDESVTRQLAANKRLAQTLGIDGTPTFVIGGQIVQGADMAQIADAISTALRGGSPIESQNGAPTKFSTSPIR
jgi:protein-disulfide isomerase